MFLMPELLSGEWIGVQYILSTVQVEYFTLFFDNRTKVIVYLKARSFKQYLAVAPFPSRSHSPDIGRKVKRPSHSCIQIWSLSPARIVSKDKSKVPDFRQMKCEMILCIVDSGPWGWCPLPSHDLVLIILLLRICSCLMYSFCHSSMMTNDNRRSWDCLVELLKTELLLFMLFLIHPTWYLLSMISPLLFVVYYNSFTTQATQNSACILSIQNATSNSPH